MDANLARGQSVQMRDGNSCAEDLKLLVTRSKEREKAREGGQI